MCCWGTGDEAEEETHSTLVQTVEETIKLMIVFKRSINIHLTSKVLSNLLAATTEIDVWLL